MSDRPELSVLSPRAAQIVSVARELLEAEGRDALTMRALAARLDIRAPSLYKHFPNKAAVESALIELGMAELGAELYRAVEKPEPVPALLRAYRAAALAGPHLYRLATQGPLDRASLAPGLEDWAGTPFFLAMGEPYTAQALFSTAHGMTILELDGRYPPGSDLDRTWAEAAHAFELLRTGR